MTGSNEGTTEEAKPLKQLHVFPSPAKLHLIRLHVRLSQREGANQLTEANSIHSNPVSPEPDPTSEGLMIQLLASLLSDLPCFCKRAFWIAYRN